MSRFVKVLVFVTLCLIWSSTWVMIKVGLEGAPPFKSAGIRFIIAAVVIFAVLGYKRIPLPRTRAFLLLSLFLGVFQMAIAYGLVYWAEQHIASGLAAVLFSSMPLTVAILARTLLGESLSRLKLIGILLGTIGVAIIFRDGLSWGGDKAIYGIVATLGSVFLASFSSIMVKKYSGPYHPLASISLPIFFGGILLLACASVMERDRSIEWAAGTIGSIVYLAIFGSVIAFSLYFWIIKHVAVTVLSYQTFIIPILACLLGWIFLRETVTLDIVIGGAMILSGIALALQGQGRKSKIDVKPGQPD